MKKQQSRDKKEQLKKARDYAHLLLKFRLRSVSELREKLAKRGFDGNIIESLVLDFTRGGLLDDARFAKYWIQDRINLKPTGRLKLRFELQQKGIAENDIAAALADIENQIDEYKMAKDLAQRKFSHMGHLERLVAKRRLFGFLQRRGFPYDVVKKVVGEVLTK